MSQVTHVTLTRESLLLTAHQPGCFPSLLFDGYPYRTLAVVVPISVASDCDSSFY